MAADYGRDHDAVTDFVHQWSLHCVSRAIKFPFHLRSDEGGGTAFATRTINDLKSREELNMKGPQGVTLGAGALMVFALTCIICGATDEIYM